MANAQPLISVIVPCYNEAEMFPLLCRALADLGAQLADRYRLEFVLIDDGSRDATWSLIERFALDDPRVKAVALSRNFGHQIALTCGYDLAEGDAVVSLDADLQDPPEVIPLLIEKWEAGADVVYAVRREREGESAFKLATAKWFYKIFHAIGHADTPANVGDFRLMSKRAVQAFCRLREKHRYIRGMVGWVGFTTDTVHYERRARVAGETKYPLRKMMAFALDGIFSFSSFPLKLSYLMAFFAAGSVFAFLLWTLIKLLLFDEPLVQGWTSLILAVTIFGALILFCLGVIGEYVGRIYEQIKQRPLYFTREILREGKPADERSADNERRGSAD